MTVYDLTSAIEELAPLSFQEDYDNAGLLIGDPLTLVKGALISLDVTEAVIDEAISLDCNLIISHHPIIFKGLKRLTGQNEVQRCVTRAIQNNIAIYAAHTNLDNVVSGVNGKIAEKFELTQCRILAPISDSLCKIATFVPKLSVQKVREAMFEAGAGKIGNYDSCSFNSEGYGSFKAGENSNPFVGQQQKIHYEPEVKIEVIVPKFKLSDVIDALKSAHPYEEPAYDCVPLLNNWNQTGAGIVGYLPAQTDINIFLTKIKDVFQIPFIKHTAIVNQTIHRVAICGGSGSFLIKDAINAHADVFITADVKYHEFMEAEGKLVIVDAGHFETEQYTKELMYDIISKKFPTFALHISKVTTNPIQYL
jgi:dinuclear metal center YbgI/SA1388 family protein